MSVFGTGTNPLQDAAKLKSYTDLFQVTFKFSCNSLNNLRWAQGTLTKVLRNALYNISDYDPPPIDFDDKNLPDPTTQVDELIRKTQSGTTFLRTLQVQGDDIKTHSLSLAAIFIGKQLQGLDVDLMSALDAYENVLQSVYKKLSSSKEEMPTAGKPRNPILPYNPASPEYHLIKTLITSSISDKSEDLAWLTKLSLLNKEDVFEFTTRCQMATTKLRYEVETIKDSLGSIVQLVLACYDQPAASSKLLAADLDSIDRGRSLYHPAAGSTFQPCFQTAYDRMQQYRHVAEPEATRRIQMFFITLGWETSVLVHEAYRVLDYQAIEMINR